MIASSKISMESKLSGSESYSAPVRNGSGLVQIKVEQIQPASASGFSVKSKPLDLHSYSAARFNSMGLAGFADEEMETGSTVICRICLEHKGDSELIAPCKCKGTQQFVHRSCLDHWRSVKEGFAFAHCTTCMAQYHLRVNFLEGYCWRNLKFRMFVARDILLVFFAIQTMISLLGGLSYLFDLDGTFRRYIGHGWDNIFSNHPVLFYYCLGALLFLAFLGIYGLFLLCLSCGPNDSSNGYSHARSTANHGYSSTEPPIFCCCGPCSGDCQGSNSDSGEGVLVAILVVIIVFALIGIFYGIFVGTIGIQRIWQKHYHILTKRVLTKEYVVEDLHGCYTEPNLDREHAQRLRTLKLL